MSTKVPLQARIDENIDIKLREIAAKHRKRPNAIVEAALSHCFSNRHFLSGLEEKLTKKEEIDY
jgi:predicted transcriptional regulator